MNGAAGQEPARGAACDAQRTRKRTRCSMTRCSAWASRITTRRRQCQQFRRRWPSKRVRLEPAGEPADFGPERHHGRRREGPARTRRGRCVPSYDNCGRHGQPVPGQSAARCSKSSPMVLEQQAFDWLLEQSKSKQEKGLVQGLHERARLGSLLWNPALRATVAGNPPPTVAGKAGSYNHTVVRQSIKVWNLETRQQ